MSKLKLSVSRDDPSIGYLSLPDHPGSGPGIVKRSVILADIIGQYDGPELVLDFDENERLIGVEIIGD